MAKPKFLQCTICGINNRMNPSRRPYVKNANHNGWSASYDYETFKRDILRGLPGRPSNLWRYQDVLPLNNPAALDLYPAGGTPLWLSQRFAY